MSINLLDGTIPFSELFERLMTLARVDSFNNEDFAKGLINDTYTRDLSRLYDWDPITEEGMLLTSAMYNTGSVSCTLGSTSVTGNGTVWTTAMLAASGWRIKFAGNDIVYGFTRTGNTAATISPALAGTQNITSGTYTIFQDEFSLPADFDRFLRNGSIYNITGGRSNDDPVGELPRDEFRRQFTADCSDPIKRAMLSRTNATTGYQMVRLNPPPRTAKLYPFDYIKKITPMREYTHGTVSIVADSTTVTGTDTLWLANLAAGMYFRLDAVGRGDSSKWYRIASIATNTSLTLTEAYADGTESGVEYTACTAPSAFPSKFHDFILYDAAVKAVMSQDDPAAEGLLSKRNDLLDGLYKDYKGRRTNVTFGVDDDRIRS